MNTQSDQNQKPKVITIFLVMFLILAGGGLLAACARQAQPAVIEEITFLSGEFNLVGDLRMPGGTGPFPVVLLVHGDAPADRTMFGKYLPIMERMLRAGYAVFSWDNPGIGESTGITNRGQIITQQAQILLDAIEVMKARSDVDPQRIGLWGSSMASYVMPFALSQSRDIAFMICESCAGISGADQMAFLRINQAICDGVPAEKEAELMSLFAELDKASKFETYPEYRHYRKVLDALASLESPAPILAGVEAVPERAWLANNPKYQTWWNPVRVIEQTKIPILVINGEMDGNLDAAQGVYAYQAALQKAGNSNYRVELLPGVNHFMAAAKTSCLTEHMKTFEQALKDQGYGSPEETGMLMTEEPGKHTPLSAWPYVPEYLDLIEDWLTELAEGEVKP